jgi:hypothetical protein
VGTPDEVANAVAFLARKKLRISPGTPNVNGGMLMG